MVVHPCGLVVCKVKVPLISVVEGAKTGLASVEVSKEGPCHKKFVPGYAYE